MKNYQEFKGYSKRLDYNSENGTFAEVSTPHQFSLLPAFASGLLNFAKSKLETVRDRRLLSRMNERDLRDLGLDERKNNYSSDRYW